MGETTCAGAVDGLIVVGQGPFDVTRHPGHLGHHQVVFVLKC